MAGRTGYEPLDTPKEVARDVWIVDGPHIRFYGLPFSTRMTVIRLSDGGLWLHSPIRLTDPLRQAIAALGPVRYLVAPNNIHYASLGDWAGAFPAAECWVAPGVEQRARAHGVELRADRHLDRDDPPWCEEILQSLAEGSRLLHEVDFFHRASRTLVLTDLIENFEPAKLPWPMRPVVRLLGMAAPHGRMPPDMRLTFRRAEDRLRDHVERMIAWGPERVILAHGAWFQSDGAAELRRAFRRLLRA
jgi:hypothetical protein